MTDINKEANKMDNTYYIVRCDRSGVFAGNIVERNGQEVTMSDARCLWYWDGAASLMQLAKDGTSNPRNCKFTETQKEVPKGARIIRRISYPSGKEYFEYREKEYIPQCVVSSCCGRAVKRFNTPAEAISVWNTRAPILSVEEMEMLEGME